jgi:bacterial polymer biosynthesis proteins, WecB/TagA/CpsF family
MLEKVDEWIQEKNGRSHHIACINAYCVSLTLKNERLKRIYNSSDIAGADGMPFVVWIRKIARESCDRYYAPDVILKLAEHSEHSKCSFFLYGGDPVVVKRMEQFLHTKFPYLRIVGSYSPPFRELTIKEDAEIVELLNSLKPDIIAVGLGTPKQDYWIDDHIEKIKGAVMVASGATFDFFGGRIKIAPRWIQRSGFEWLYRLFSKDFFRLWKRYTVSNFVFLFYFLLQVFNIYEIENKRVFRKE